MVNTYQDEHIFRYCLICGKKLNCEKPTWGIAHGNWQYDEGGAYFAMGDQPTFYICESCLKPYLESPTYLKSLANVMLNYAVILRYYKKHYGNSIRYYIRQFKIRRDEYFQLVKKNHIIRCQKEIWRKQKESMDELNKLKYLT